MADTGATPDRLTILRCKAANARQIAASFEQEAIDYEQEAHAEARRTDSDLCSDDFLRHNLPDDWMSIAELPLPPRST